MHLPNAEIAVVAREKIVNYLLNPEHPDGWSKARFFSSLGFTIVEWHTFATALRKVATGHPVKKIIESNHGRKYIIEGAIDSPFDDRATVRTVWIVDSGELVPRLVTAYPM
jgi:hypothetical protein